MKSRLASAGTGLALLLSTITAVAQSGVPVQLAWQAPANCPQAAQVRQKLRDLLGASAAEVAPSRLRAEGRIEPVRDRFRLTLNIHYDLVNGTRVVQASSCENLGGVAAVTLALLFRAEHSSSAPLTARDLGGSSSAVGAEDRSAVEAVDRARGSEDQSSGPQDRSSAAHAAAEPQAFQESERARASDPARSNPTRWRFAFRVPELRTDLGVLPAPSYGIGLAAGLRHDAWRLLASATFWLGQDYESGPFVGYGAHFGRVSGELSACRGWQFSAIELAPCLLLSLDDVSARGTGVGVSSTNPRIAWLSVGAGFQGLWSLGRSASLVLGVSGRISTSRPRFVSESVGQVAQVGPAAFGVVLGCEWVL